MTVQQAIKEMEAYVSKCGGSYSKWYAGIATNPKDTLFNRHNVDEKNGNWSHRTLSTDTEARQVEDHFLAKGCAGGDGGGDKDTKSAYLYKETSSTRR